MKKTLLAATSLLALVAFGAQASEEAKTEATKAEHAAPADAAKPAEGTTEAKPADAAPAAGEAKKEEAK